jgi:hypothetical protein
VSPRKISVAAGRPGVRVHLAIEVTAADPLPVEGEDIGTDELHPAFPQIGQKGDIPAEPDDW